MSVECDENLCLYGNLIRNIKLFRSSSCVHFNINVGHVVTEYQIYNIIVIIPATAVW